ncbi:hypothetical protein WJX75_003983 [Coccomyxa subellipsoidea]|uniref:Uncharacterized protein n=1 Tax=Coccomyxa subellipsoidea TaxID=248742 RepID=A0ABR2Z2L0_9CHLO
MSAVAETEKIGEDSRHIVVSPGDVSMPDAPDTATLLVLLPGAYMKPDDYMGIIAGLRGKMEGKVSLWVAAAHPIWQEVDIKAPDAMQQATQRVAGAVNALLQQAQQEGFPAAILPSGRITNMVILAHSSAALFAAPLASRLAGALILLGSYLFPSSEYHASLREFSRPVMHLGGMLDGQARFSKMAIPAQEAAAFAYQSDPMYAAAQKPVILLPGVNHANLSNGHMRSDANDLSAEVSLESANLQVASAIADFLLVHRATDEQEVDAALQRLVQQCINTAEWLAPFTRALGRGSIDYLWKRHEPEIKKLGYSDLFWAAAFNLAFFSGAEVLPDSDTSRRFVAHSGELSAASEMCTHVQTRLVLLADQMDPDSMSPVIHFRIVSSVHTDLDAFIRSQPTLQPCKGNDGASLVLHVHCYLYRPNLVPFGHRFPVAPQYFLKLKSAEAIALVCHGPDIGNPNKADAVSAAEVNAETYQWALENVDRESRELFLQRGKQLSFVPDRDVSKEIATPVQWIKDMPLDFHDTGPNGTSVCSPVVKTAAVHSSGKPGPEAAFQGNHYMKIISRAGAMEWIMCDGLRPSSHQP